MRALERGAAAGLSLSLFSLPASSAGCVPTETALPDRGVAVSGPPPPPVAESPPQVAPYPNAVWVAGYWHWTGMHYAWIPGHWENAPPGTAWNAPRYVRTDAGYIYEAGTWKAAPAPPANALR